MKIADINKESAKRSLDSLVRSAERIRPEQLAIESRLMTTKWYDYRFMSPYSATLMFAKIYQDQFRLTIEKVVDRNLARNVQGINLAKVKTSQKEMTALWTARQRADELGVRYQEYLHFCFQFATDVQRRKLPRPNQLYFSKKSEIAWILKLQSFWEERLAERLAKIEDLPQYRIEFFQGLPAQIGYREFVLDRWNKGSRRLRDDMRLYSVEKRQVPIREFLRFTDRERFLDELQALQDDERAFPFQVADRDLAITRDELWQTCFGVPHAHSEQHPWCAMCPQAPGCQRLAGLVLKIVAERHGTTDPLKARERERTRERVRRHREKKRLAAARIGAGSPLL